MRKLFIILLTGILLLSLVACGQAESFQCDYCGKTVEEGKKYETVDSYGDTWNACEDCYEELQEMKNALN